MLSSNLVINPGQVSQFREAGFLCLEAVTTPEEVASVRATLERLFARQAGREEGAQYDILGHDGDDQPSKLPTIIRPTNFAPELRRTLFRANTTAIARQLLGPEAGLAFEMGILKPAHHGGATPWHQDEATRVDDGFEYRQVSFWMPLQPATLENGCLCYIRGSHLGDVLPHRSPGSDPRVHAIECAGEFDPSTAIPCPLPPGGVVVHHGRTLHYAGPNTTDLARYAYILAYETPPIPLSRSRGFHWNREKRTANVERRSRWRKRGGVLVEMVRRFRSGAFNSPTRLLFEIRRAARALLHRA